MSNKLVKISEWKDYCAGMPAAVLGGGPSLPGDMARLPASPTGAPGAGCILISVNYHAELAGVNPDFMVFNDHPESDDLLLKMVENTKAIRVSPGPMSDLAFDVAVWTGFYSSNTAAWFGLWLGCDPVILCGMDCYQGKELYCHPSERDFPSRYYPLDDHLRPWIEDGRRRLPHVERLRVMSGPLTRVFPMYHPTLTPALSLQGRGSGGGER